MRKPPKEGVAQVASIKGVSQSDTQKLLDQIADLEAKLAVAEKGRTDAEKEALALVEAQSALGSFDQERPTGKKIKIRRLKEMKEVGYRDDGRPILKPIFENADVPTFFYKINLPPVGGDGLKVNGLLLAHNATYEFDLHSLRSVKEMVYRIWDHERNIHGSDENAYRPHQNNVLRGPGRANA